MVADRGVKRISAKINDVFCPMQDRSSKMRYMWLSSRCCISSPDGSGMESTAAPTSPQPASGNGVIGPHKKIRGVGFGDIFREGSVKLKVRLPSPETEERKERVSVTQTPQDKECFVYLDT